MSLSTWYFDLKREPWMTLRQMRVTQLDGEVLRFQEIIDGLVIHKDVTLPIEIIFDTCPNLAILARFAAESVAELDKTP